MGADHTARGSKLRRRALGPATLCRMFPDVPLSGTPALSRELNEVISNLKGDFPCEQFWPVPRAFVISPSLADYYIVQEPTTKRCRIVEERPASPGIGVVIGGVGFGVRTEAESRMRTVEECRESGTSGGTTVIEERETRPAR